MTESTTSRPGPTHLEGLTEPAPRPANESERRWAELLEIGWAGRLRTADGRTRFRLRYHGNLHEGLVTYDDDCLPALVVAVPEGSTGDGDAVVVFDGAAHGYEALFYEEWDADALAARAADQAYVAEDGQELFELVVWAGYNVDWTDEDERAEVADVDDPGHARMVDGRRIPFEVVARDGFDAFSVTAIDTDGRSFEVVSESLA